MKEFNNKRAVIYARFSSTNQKETSITVQLDFCNKYAIDNGYEIIDTYIDQAQSGTTENRESFQKMIMDAKQRKFSNVIVYNLSRFSRHMSDHLHYVEILGDYGVKLLSVQEGFDDSTPEGALFNMIQMSLNQFYSANISRAVLQGAIATAREEEFTGGLAPLGLKVIDKKYVIDEENADTVRTIFRLFNEGYNYTYISNYLNERGMLTQKGNYWNGQFEHILTNRKYTGCLTYNLFKRKKLFSKKQIKEEKDDEEKVIIKGSFPAIIKESEFEKTQNLLKIIKEIGYENYYNPEYLLDGLVWCGKCGKMMKGTSLSSNGRIRKIYRCRNYSNRSCKEKPINVNKLDNFILDYITVLLSQNTIALKKTINTIVEQEKIRLNQYLDNIQKYDAKEANTIVNLSDTIERNPRLETKLMCVLSDKMMLKVSREKKIRDALDRIDKLSEEIIFNIKETKNKLRELTKTDLIRLVKTLIKGIYISNENIDIIINFGIFTLNLDDNLVGNVRINRIEVTKLNKKSR